MIRLCFPVFAALKYRGLPIQLDSLPDATAQRARYVKITKRIWTEVADMP